MRTSPVTQSTQEATAALHEAAQYWGQVFAGETSSRTQLEGRADAVARVFEAFQIAYSALPRFRTEAALRRFTDALQELVRAMRALQLPSTAGALRQAITAAEQGVEHAESAFAALTGKTAEPQEKPALVQGVIQRLMADRGYGFVRSQDSGDVFFTAQALQGVQFATLRTGQSVKFRIVPDPRVPGRMQAVDVQAVR